MTFGQIKNVTYATAGLKEWKYRLTLTNSQILYCHSKIQIDGVPVPTTTTFNRTINQPCSVNAFGIDQVEFTGVRPHSSKVASAILEIDYAGTNGCGTITKPLIVVEGFDSGILGVENVLGENEYRKFRFETDNDFNDLPAQLDSYDIIYINFKNSRDYLQRNAYLVEDIIKWVNSVKVGNIPNVVLGQSMGGILARYALKDMENEHALNPTIPSWQQKTSLYISHDAPHQGANTPLAIQYFSRHLINQFISTPLGDMNINVNGDGAPVTISDLQKLLNAPGTQQLLIDNVSSSFAISNTLGNAWRTELRNLGYPLQTRNIAISNGNYCANPQSFSPLDNLFTFGGSVQTSTLTAFLIVFLGANTISAVGLAVAFNEPGLLLGILPGNSKFDLDFYGKALPAVGNTNQIYHGRITFTKTLYSLFGWTPRITVVLTNRDYNAPGGLSYDYYPGGSYTSLFTSSTSGTPSNLSAFLSFGIQVTARDNFNFIPTPSALDIGGGQTTLNNSDFFTKYNVASPPLAPKNSPFANFTTSLNQNNNLNAAHISFNRLNGDWLATELDNDAQNNQIFNCGFICAGSEISGNSLVCNSEKFSAPPSPATTFAWTVTQGANLVTLTNANSSTCTVTSNNSNSGSVTLALTLGNNLCGTTIITKNIYVGVPTFPSTGEISGPDNVTFGQTVTYTYTGATSGYTWQIIAPYNDNSGNTGAWQIISGQNTSTITVTAGSITGSATIKISKSNACGIAIKYMYTMNTAPNNGGGRDPDPCDPNLSVYPNPLLNNSNLNLNLIRPIPDPCADQDARTALSATVINQVKIYNFFGVLVYLNNCNVNSLNLDNLNLITGNYTLNVFTSDGKILREILVAQ
jgi:hypothetical protein